MDVECRPAQVFAQPLFASVESSLAGRSPYLEQHPARLRLVLRSCYVLFTAGVAVAIPCAPTGLCGRQGTAAEASPSALLVKCAEQCAAVRMLLAGPLLTSSLLAGACRRGVCACADSLGPSWGLWVPSASRRCASSSPACCGSRCALCSSLQLSAKHASSVAETGWRSCSAVLLLRVTHSGLKQHAALALAPAGCCSGREQGAACR